ncbi:MAG: hypothetical protein V3W41_11480 [Planctomycetota bacterium]
MRRDNDNAQKAADSSNRNPDSSGDSAMGSSWLLAGLGLLLGALSCGDSSPRESQEQKAAVATALAPPPEWGPGAAPIIDVLRLSEGLQVRVTVNRPVNVNGRLCEIVLLSDSGALIARQGLNAGAGRGGADGKPAFAQTAVFLIANEYSILIARVGDDQGQHWESRLNLE